MHACMHAQPLCMNHFEVPLGARKDLEFQIGATVGGGGTTKQGGPVGAKSESFTTSKVPLLMLQG